ncbi:MAG: hypothetical protein M8364_14705 [Methylobacter sp.]|uniref:hypothetical protein n=1 Tax=Methylobacter sp. TaxID=2051955 RepID=UPI00258F05F2|nr:hypothetical protein [Methylobacter sp.]MCL7422146.1 hypothetical protein [Methylobacter sp.]
MEKKTPSATQYLPPAKPLAWQILPEIIPDQKLLFPMRFNQSACIKSSRHRNPRMRQTPIAYMAPAWIRSPHIAGIGTLHPINRDIE